MSVRFSPSPVLVIGCGALAAELLAVVRASRWEHVQVTCLPARLHNRPERIADAVRDCIRAHRKEFTHILVAYGDCGTGGRLDRVLHEEGVERIPGAHCYEFLTGSAEFSGLLDDEPGTFFLTDFLVRHFDALVMRGLGIEQHPELLPLYFGNYRRLVYLVQHHDPDMIDRARAAAQRLGLELELRPTGLQPLRRLLLPLANADSDHGKAHHRVLA